MCMFILWLSMVTRHINPFPQSLQSNLLSESAIWTPCIWCFTFFTTTPQISHAAVHVHSVVVHGHP